MDKKKKKVSFPLREIFPTVLNVGNVDLYGGQKRLEFLIRPRSYWNIK